MKLPDDMLPEEQDPQYEELITLLQNVNLNPLLINTTERAQLLSQARARLFQTDPEGYQTAAMSVPTLSELGSFPSKPNALIDNRHRGKRLTRLVNVVAALLVVAALIGASLLLFRDHQTVTGDHPTSTSPIGPFQTIESAQTRSQGLELTIKVPPGPYFLSEMLEVQITFVNNNSQASFQMLGPRGETCPGSFKAVMTGGESPYDTTLKNNLAAQHTCVNSRDMVFQPGWGANGPSFVALTSSGHVTLTAQAGFQKGFYDKQRGYHPDTTVSPFEGQSPSLQITVQTQVPPDRSITVHQQGSQVIVDAPPNANQLVYMETANCSPTDRRTYWNDLYSTTLPPPDCGTSSMNGTSTPNKLLWWTYVVGEPGYAMVSGVVNQK